MATLLVTGASRGIGAEITRRMVDRGWTVHAGVRRAEDGERLRESLGGAGERVQPVVLDVTDPAAVAALPEALGGRLDGLVNNAGIVVGGPVEGTAVDELRRQLDVNVVGQVAVTQAALPLLRASSGRIVFIGSVSGRVSSPMLGPYAASKFALEGLADALRIELRPWGIGVSLIEPGSIDTDLWRGAHETADATEAALAPEYRELYAAHLKGLRRLVTQIQKRTSPPATVAVAVEHALTDARPRARYLVGADAKAQVALRGMAPTRVFDAILARATGIR